MMGVHENMSALGLPRSTDRACSIDIDTAVEPPFQVLSEMQFDELLRTSRRTCPPALLVTWSITNTVPASGR
jgi:hypothetical protein